MGFFNHEYSIQGKSNDITELNAPSSTVFVAQMSDVDYPASVRTSKLFCLGLLEADTLTKSLKEGSDIELSAGNSKTLTLVVGISCTVISPMTLEEIYEILDSDMALFLVEHRKYIDSAGFSSENKVVPDDTILECSFAMYNCSGSVGVLSQDKDVTRIALKFFINDTSKDIKPFYNEDVYLTVGDESWESFGDNFLDSYIDNGGTVDGPFLKKILYNAWGIIDFSKTDSIKPGLGRQLFNHTKLDISDIPDRGVSTLYEGYYVDMRRASTADVEWGDTNFNASNQRFAMFYIDFFTQQSGLFRYICQIGGGSTSLSVSDGVGIYVTDVGTDTTISAIATYGGGSLNANVEDLVLTGDDFRDKAERIFLYDFKTETLYYYNITQNLFYSKTNSANNTVTFPNPGSVFYRLGGLGMPPGSKVFPAYKFGYAIW